MTVRGLHKQGLTVVEALIAMILMSIGFMAVLSFLGVNLHHATQSRNRVLALILVENLLEEIEDELKRS